MTPYRLKTFIRKHNILNTIAKFIFYAYENCVWSLFGMFFHIHMIFPRARPGASRTVKSVLHVSVLSHKPFMLSRIMRNKGLKSSYLAVHAEAGWLKVGSKGYDYNIPWNIRGIIFRPFITVYYFWHIMRHYDVIHYHFASFLTNDGRELPYLKKMDKIIAVHFRGCDLRQKSINNKLNPVLNCCQECDYPEGSCETEIQYTRIEKARKFADLLFVTTPDLLDFLPEAEHIPFTAPYGIDLDDVPPAPKDEHIFRVVTSSNHDGVDGTEYVENAVDRLKREGRAVELVKVHNTPYEKALSLYKSADVYAGKLRMGYYNNANIECMLMGIPCMSYIREEFLKNILDCPIIITRPETVYDRLKEYMDKPEALKLHSEEGRKFALKYHDPQSVVDKLVTKYNCALNEIVRK